MDANEEMPKGNLHDLIICDCAWHPRTYLRFFFWVNGAKSLSWLMTAFFIFLTGQHVRLTVS